MRKLYWFDVCVILAASCTLLALVLTFWLEPAPSKCSCPVAAFVHGGTSLCPISPGGK